MRNDRREGSSGFGAWLCLLALLLIPSSAFTQLNETGNLNGTVTDEEGLWLPGVTVTLTSPDLIQRELVVVTNNTGLYRFSGLPPGVFEAKFELAGFQTSEVRQIRIGVGRTTTVDRTLEIESLEETLTVTDKAPLMDRQSTTQAIIYDVDFLELTPAPRTVLEYAEMSPGMTPASGGISSHGATVRDNTFNLDGVNVTDPAVGTRSNLFSLNIMKELSVQQGGLSAEYGSVRGAVVNVVTQSGGNTFRADGNLFYSSGSLRSDNRRGTPLEQEATQQKSGVADMVEGGVYLGGPIIKDRLWYFANLSFDKREDWVIGYPHDAEQIPTNHIQHYPFAKLTWQPGSNDRVTFSYNYFNSIQDHGGAGTSFNEESTRRRLSPTHIFNLNWTRSFGPDFFANFKLGYTKRNLDFLAKNDQPRIFEYSSSTATGGYGYDNLYDRNRLQFVVNSSYFLDDTYGSHELKFGGEFQHALATRTLNYRTHDPSGAWLYVTRNGEPWIGYYQEDIDDVQKIQNYAAFLQDTWRPTRQLTLNLGVRLDHYRGIVPRQNEDEGPRTFMGHEYNRSVTESFTPVKWLNLAPRLSGIYDLRGDGRTLIKGSYSRYYSHLIGQYFYALNPNGFAWYYAFLNSEGTGPGLVYNFDLPDTTVAGYKEHDLRCPYTDELILAVEHEVTSNWAVGLRYIKKWERDLLEDVDGAALDMDRLMDDGELVWNNYEPVTAVDPYNGQDVTFWNRIELLEKQWYLVNPPGAERNYDAFEIAVNRRYANNWQLRASYVWQDVRGLLDLDYWPSTGYSSRYDNPNSHIYGYGRLFDEHRHQFKLNWIYRGPWGINTGAYFRYLSGRRYSRLVRSQDLGVELNQGYVSVTAGERGSFGYPAEVRLDVRLEKELPFTPRQTVTLFVDVFNLFNRGAATGVKTTSSSPAIVFQEVTAIQDPRVVRVGARYSF